MQMTEVIRTSGDIRRVLAQTMMEIKNGELSTEKGMAIAALSKEITASMQTEVNVAKVRVAMLSAGANLGELTKLGQLIIEDAGSVPTISGR